MPYVLGHCFLKHKLARDMTYGRQQQSSHNSRFHRPWLPDRRISHWCSKISTSRLPLSHCAKTAFCSDVLVFDAADAYSRSFSEFFSVTNVTSFFINETNKDNIIQQLLWAEEFCSAICFKLSVSYPADVSLNNSNQKWFVWTWIVLFNVLNDESVAGLLV